MRKREIKDNQIMFIVELHDKIFNCKRWLRCEENADTQKIFMIENFHEDKYVKF